MLIPKKENLQLFLRYFNLTRPCFAKLINLDMTVVRGLLRGASKRKKHFEKIASVFSLPLEIFYNDLNFKNPATKRFIFNKIYNLLESSSLNDTPFNQLINTASKAYFLSSAGLDDEFIENYIEMCLTQENAIAQVTDSTLTDA